MTANGKRSSARAGWAALALLSSVSSAAWAGEPRAAGERPALVASPRGDGSTMVLLRRTTNEERAAAAYRAAQRRRDAERARATAPPAAAVPAGPRGAFATVLRMALAQVAAPLDLYAAPNYANSPLPTAHCAGPGANPLQTCQKDADCAGYVAPVPPALYSTGATCSGPVVAGTGMRKFVDTLPSLCAGATPATNNLGQCIPLATPDASTFPGADYYEIGLRDYAEKMHSDLPATKLRGYYQKNVAATDVASRSHYLGPFILAQTNRPVRVKFVNELGVGAAGKLFVPVDPSLAGAGDGPVADPRKPGSFVQFTENRATLHLHGGNTQWTSDGFQHQWTVPAGEFSQYLNNTISTPGDLLPYKKGVSTRDVPDMWFDPTGKLVAGCQGLQSCAAAGAANNPGDGAMTFYWTNQQSGRLMFFHDHSYGITRLNVYAGEAAPYLLVDPADEDALARASVPGTLGTTKDLAHLFPLVIQDKTYVPPAPQLAAEDPTWDTLAWGGPGSLWFPHVYTPNQWPDNPDKSATNPMGRWDYGPWFHPPQTLLAVNGVARPLTVPCTSAAARTALNPTGATTCPSTPNPSAVPESFLDTMVVNGTAYPTVTVDPAAYRFLILNAAQERNVNLSFFVADATGTEVPMVPATPHTTASNPPLCSPTAPQDAATGLPAGCWPGSWPTDGRLGGVPDPASAGPKIVQIGTEGGVLPAPATITAMPVGYDYNRRSIVVLNVLNKALFMGPAERADVVVDFSKYAGKTLILYNDAPAPVPGFDTRYDYFTGDPDQTSTGGAPTTLPGYGPNTRTIMQVKVRATGAAQAPFSPAAAGTALATLFKTRMPTPIVPESVYGPVYGAALADTYFTIQANNTTFTPVCASTTPPSCPAGQPTPLTLTFGQKAIQELFDIDYGRMNSTLGVELPLTNFLTQTTIPYNDWDPTTEYIEDNKPQIWKITHNGVDTHAIHFHLLNAQVINRVGWDGQIRPPDDNELGWKDTVRMHPLEDVYVALQPVRQTLPWPLPDSIRPLDVTRPLGTTTEFTGTNVDNQPIKVTNQLANFGWEYVWHCHLLGHEEDDMLRPEVFVVAPEAPTSLVATSTPAAGGGITAALSWRDNSRSAMTFNVQRASDALFRTGVTSVSIAAPAPQPGTVAWTDPSAAAATTYYYRVQAQKALSSVAISGTNPGSAANPYVAGSAWSNVALLGPAPAAAVAPASLAFGSQLVKSPSVARVVTLTNTGKAALNIISIGFVGVNAADFAQTSTCGVSLAAPAAPATSTSCTISVVFTPLTGGARTATLAIASNDPTNPTLAVTLTGSGIAPAVAVAPASLTFAGQLLRTASAAQPVTVSNVGTLPLSLTGITLGGLAAGDFSLVNGCGASLAAPVAPATSTSCTVSVAFTPTATGARSASLTVASNDPLNPSVTVALAGTGTAPAAAVAPASLTFGLQALRTTSPAQRVNLSNVGTATLGITSVALAGADAGDFALVNGCGPTLAAPLAPGATSLCPLSITFAPRLPATGRPSVARSASLVIVTTDPNPASATLTVPLAGTAGFPVASVSPASLAFLGQLVNTTSAAQAVTVSNTGNTALPLGVIALGGAGAGDFVLNAAGCGASLAAPVAPAAATSCTVTVAFAPKSLGAKSASLTVNSGDPVGPALSVALAGDVLGPIATVSPASLAFGPQLVAVGSAPQVVTLANTGTSPLLVSSIATTGDFSAVTTCPRAPAGSLASPPGASSCTITVTFTPTATGARTGSLTIASSDAVNPVLTVPLTGSGTYLNVSPGSVAFGNQPVGVASASVSVTLSNDGAVATGLSAPAVAGANATDFAIATDCLATLAPATLCTVTVTFTPTAGGPRTASLVLGTPAGGTQTVPLSGTGIAPLLVVSPAALSGFVSSLNVASAAQTLTVTNLGTAPATLDAIAFTDPLLLGSFSETDTCGLLPATLAVGASCTIRVVFTPTGWPPTAHGDVLVVSALAPGTPVSVPVSGTVYNPILAVSADLVFLPQPVGSVSAPQTVTVSNTGAGNLVITGIALGGLNPTEFAIARNGCPIGGAGLPAGLSCTVDVTAIPATTLGSAATLNVNVAAPATSLTVNLSATGM